MKTTDKAELVRLAREAAAHEPDERDAFFDRLAALLEEDDEKAKDLVKPRRERE